MADRSGLWNGFEGGVIVPPTITPDTRGGGGQTLTADRDLGKLALMTDTQSYHGKQLGHHLVKHVEIERNK